MNINGEMYFLKVQLIVDLFRLMIYYFCLSINKDMYIQSG